MRKWEEDGIVPRELWLKAGAEGLLCCTVPEEYGGMGLDYLFDVVVFEELWRSGASGPGFLIHTDLVATYHALLRHRGAEAKVAAEDGLGRSDRLARHDGTSRRQRPQGDPDPRRPRWRRFRHQRPEGVHLQRPALRFRRARDQDGRHAGAKGVTLFIVESDRPGFQARPKPRKARHEGPGYVGTVLR